MFRWFRITLLLILFLVVAGVTYLRLAGLPDFLKRPLLRRLMAEGVAAQFGNMQLGWARGPSIVIENAAFSRSHQPLSPRLSASRAELALSWDALLHCQIELDSLQVSSAQLQFPVSETNGDTLLLTNVALDMRFYSNDVVRINDCRGTFRGLEMDLIGGVSHASDMLHWKLPSSGGSDAFQTRLRQLARTVEKIHLSGRPLLRIDAGVDGRDPNSFKAGLNFAAPTALTPWGDVTNLVMEAACARLADSSNQPILQVKWSAANLATPWARGGKVSFSTILSRGATSNFDAEIRMEAARFNATLDSSGSNWFAASRLSWNGTATLAYSNFLPLLATGTLRAVEPQTAWGSADEMFMECRATRAQDQPPPEASWGSWTRIAPWTLDWRAELRNITSPKLRFDHLAFSGRWHAPQVVIENLQGELYGGQVNAGAILDIASRELHCDGVTDFDPHSISQLFKPAAQNWMAQYEWTAPPMVNAQLRVVLPPWTNRPADWPAAMEASLQVAGDFTVGPSAFRRVPVLSGGAHVTYTNRVWNVSHLHAIRPDGDCDLDYTSSPQGYRYVIDSRMDPRDALPLFAPRQQHVLDEVSFTKPPDIHAEVSGRWREPERMGFIATVRATNFIARGEPVRACNAAVDYTNLLLTVHNFYLSNIQCQVRAPWLQADLGTKMARVTNGAATLDPAVLRRVLRGQSPPFLNNIHFDAPAVVSASGSFSLTNQLAMDLHFLVSGQRVHYTNLLADRATGGVDWTGRTVAVTNVVATLYNNGTLKGWIVFDSKPQHGSDFRANLAATDIDLSSLVAGVTGTTNHVEGRLDGDLALAGPYSAERSNWQGCGHIHAHDALLWDIKLFGLLSPVLNAISPGWGHSRAREASASFVITNGVIASDDLELSFQGFKLNFRGTVDNDKKINARLEAVLLRDTPVLGPFLSMAFTPLSKLFEYRITGPLRNPVLEPVYVPKFILLFLHPFHTLKTFATPGSPSETAPLPSEPDNAK